ncbi:MAG: phosphoribosylglycinamide formyltransferase [bacterium]
MQLNLAIFASGRGSNFQAILRAIHQGRLQARVAVLVADNPEAEAVQIAQAANVAAAVIDARAASAGETFAADLLATLQSHRANFIVLSGYVRKVPGQVIQAYRGRVINIHPALLPSFGGKGMYGRRVHEAVLHHGCKVSGATVHFVEEEYDTGAPIVQRCVPVLDEDTPDTLAARVLEIEHQILPEALQLFAEDRVQILGRRVLIRTD